MQNTNSERDLSPPISINNPIGTIRHLETRTVQNVISWTFLLDRFDDSGNNVGSIPVEIRGRELQGFVSEGDKVKVVGTWKGKESLCTTRIYDLTSNSHFVSICSIPDFKMTQTHPYLRKKKRGTYEEYSGQVTDLHKRKEGHDELWTFSLVRYDNNDNILIRIDLMIKGKEIEGNIREGDQIIFLDEWKHRKRYKVKKVFNLTTNSMIKKTGLFG